jgi:hypothetical protein
MAIGNPVGPNIKKSSKYDTDGKGKSRGAYYEGGVSVPQNEYLKFQNVGANFNFVLPANTRLFGDIVIFNNSAATQAAITVGTAAAGTQISAGATVATLTTAVQAATDSAITRADRTIYVESAAWQSPVHIVFQIRSYPAYKDLNGNLY